MTKTTNYQLNQWAAADRVLREDFNADNEKIDAALAAAGNCHIAVGSYTGTGTYGADAPNSLTFDFEPMILFMNVQNAYSSGTHLVWFSGGTNYGNPGDSSVHYQITWNGNSVSWYPTGCSDKNCASYQFNTAEKEYHYIAIGC